MIGELAQNVIRLSGFEPGAQIPIDVVGLRPGERLNEALIMEGESLLPTTLEKVFMVQNHRLDVQAFRRDFDVLRQSVLARDQGGTVSQRKVIAARY